MSFWQAKSKSDRSDILFSNFIRKRDGWKCQYKKKCDGVINYKEIGETGKLHCSHYHGRGKRTVRFDTDNCDAACNKCHAYYEDHKKELGKWKRNQLGEVRFRNLEIRANQTQRIDKRLELLYVKQLIKTTLINTLTGIGEER